MLAVAHHAAVPPRPPLSTTLGISMRERLLMGVENCCARRLTCPAAARRPQAASYRSPLRIPDRLLARRPAPGDRGDPRITVAVSSRWRAPGARPLSTGALPQPSTVRSPEAGQHQEVDPARTSASAPRHLRIRPAWRTGPSQFGRPGPRFQLDVVRRCQPRGRRVEEGRRAVDRRGRRRALLGADRCGGGSSARSACWPEPRRPPTAEPIRPGR